ncbi:MAG: hypothetical protein ABR579_11380 [Actinomycetota bacterium]
MPGRVVGHKPDVVGAVRGWAFDLHLMGYEVPPGRMLSAERAAVAAYRMGASFEEALEFARVALREPAVPAVVTL